MTVEWNVIATIAAPIIALCFGVWLNRRFESRPRLVSYFGAINLADSQPPTLLVVTAKDLGKRPLDLEIGDTILWRGDDMRIRNEEEGMILISPGMKGKVITRSENLLADAARKAGLPIDAPVTHFSQGRRALVR